MSKVMTVGRFKICVNNGDAVTFLPKSQRKKSQKAKHLQNKQVKH